MNITQIETALSQKISASSSNFDLLAAAKAVQLLKTNGVFVVNSTVDLPAAGSNEGKIYFVENIETVVWSNGGTWFKLLDKNTVFPFQLWTWGSNYRGRLGDGTKTSRCSPVRELCSATDWCQVSAGEQHSAAVKFSGQLWAWGRNDGAAVGDGTLTDRCSPTREFCSATDWCQVSGSLHSAAIKTSGQLWTWGGNNCGQLGDGTLTDRCSPVRERCSATDWCGVCQGFCHTAAIKTTGEIWAWGSNGCGQLGVGNTTTRCSPTREFYSATNWCGVSAGVSRTSGIKTTGQIWNWGMGICGQLGNGTITLCTIPSRERCSATDWCAISVGHCHSVAIKTSGQIWTWGMNQCGALGNGFTTDSCSPVRERCSATDWCQASAGNLHTAAIKTTGQLWTWGGSTPCGQLGDGTLTHRCSPVREISSATDWSQVSAGSLFTMAIKVVI